jgi:hypothetical protein
MALQLAFAETLLLLLATMVFGTIQTLPARIRHAYHTTVGAHTTSYDGADLCWSHLDTCAPIDNNPTAWLQHWYRLL